MGVNDNKYNWNNNIFNEPTTLNVNDPFLLDPSLKEAIQKQQLTNIDNNQSINEGLANKAFIEGATWYAKLHPEQQVNNTSNWFGKDGYIYNGAQAVNALSGLADAYTGLKSLGLAKKEFNFNKNLALTNLANQADLINEQRLKSAKVGLALAGNTLTPDEKQSYLNNVKANNVNGSL